MSRKLPLGLVAFLQSAALFIYCSLIGLIFWQGNKWFGSVPNFWGPLLFLVLFSTSALICALLTLGYPVVLIWKKKQVVKAIKLAAYTAGWLVFFILLIISVIVVGRAY